MPPKPSISRRTAAGLSHLNLDPANLFAPSPLDIRHLRAAVRSWGVSSFSPRNYPLLLRALTHPSTSHWAAISAGTSTRPLSHAPLEFLGDRVLSVALCGTHVDTNFLDAGDDDLKIKAETASDLALFCAGGSRLIGNAGYELVARKVGIDKLVRCHARFMNDRGTMANVYEAVAGAVYVDGGMKAAEAFVETTIAPWVEEVDDANLGSVALEKLLEKAVGRDGRVEVQEVSEEKVDALGAGEAFGARVLLRGSLGKASGSAAGSVVLAESFGSNKAHASSRALRLAIGAVGKIRSSAKENAPAKALLTALGPMSPQKRNETEWKHWRIEQAMLQSGSRSVSSLDKSAVDNCMRASGASGPPSGADICELVTSSLVAELNRGPTWARGAIGDSAMLGNFIYRLVLGEAAYCVGPNATREELHRMSCGIDEERKQLVVLMGGRGIRGSYLLRRPFNKLMLYVAIGLVARNCGSTIARAWVDGGLALLVKKRPALLELG